MREIIVAFGLFLFIEGALYALFPSKMRNMLEKLKLMNGRKNVKITKFHTQKISACSIFLEIQ